MSDVGETISLPPQRNTVGGARRTKDMYRDRVHKAVDIARTHGHLQSAKHKSWVIDQIMRALMSRTEYIEFVREYQLHSGDDRYWVWHKGEEPPM